MELVNITTAPPLVTSDIFQQNWTNTNITDSMDNVTTQLQPTLSPDEARKLRMYAFSLEFNIYGLLVIHGIGLVSNAIVIITMLSTSQLRGNSSGILIIALAISDFLTNILRVFEPVIKSNATCTFLDYAFRSFAMQTRFVMVLISVNRYALVCYPMKHRKVTNNKTTTIQVAVMSIFSLAASSFAAVVPHVYQAHDNNCYAASRAPIHYYIYFYGIIVSHLAVGNITPILVTSLLTVLTIVQLRKTGALGKPAKGESKRSKAQRSITKALLGVGIVFIITGIPTLATSTAYLAMANEAYKYPGFLDNVIAMIYFATFYEVNHSINFFIYISYHTRFKSTLLKIFKCKCKELNEET